MLLLGLVGCLVSGPEVEARPQKQVTKERREAQTLVKQGVRKLREGDYVSALDLFSRAYALFPSHKIQFNLAQTYSELGRHLDAIGAYEAFLAGLARDTPEAVRRLAQGRIKELFDRIALVTLRCEEPEAAVTVDGQAMGRTPLGAPLRLMPGPHSVVVRKEGFLDVVWNVEVKAGERLVREVRLERPRSKVVEVPVVYRTVRKRPKGLPLLWTSVAFTAAATITVAITGGLSLREQELAKDVDKPWSERVAVADRGKMLQRSTDGLLIVTGVVAAGALAWYLLVVRPSTGTERVRVTDPPKVTLTPAAGPQGAALDLAVSF